MFQRVCIIFFSFNIVKLVAISQGESTLTTENCEFKTVTLNDVQSADLFCLFPICNYSGLLAAVGQLLSIFNRENGNTLLTSVRYHIRTFGRHMP